MTEAAEGITGERAEFTGERAEFTGERAELIKCVDPNKGEALRKGV